MTSIQNQTAIRIRSGDGQIDETFGPFRAEDSQRIFMALHDRLDQDFSIETIPLNLTFKDHPVAAGAEEYQSFIDSMAAEFGPAES